MPFKKSSDYLICLYWQVKYITKPHLGQTMTVYCIKMVFPCSIVKVPCSESAQHFFPRKTGLAEELNEPRRNPAGMTGSFV